MTMNQLLLKFTNAYWNLQIRCVRAHWNYNTENFYETMYHLSIGYKFYIIVLQSFPFNFLYYKKRSMWQFTKNDRFEIHLGVKSEENVNEKWSCKSIIEKHHNNFLVIHEY